MFYNWYKINESFFDDIEDDIIDNNIISDNIQHKLYDNDIINCNNSYELCEFIIKNTQLNDIIMAISQSIKIAQKGPLTKILYNYLQSINFNTQLYHVNISTASNRNIIKFISKDNNYNYDIDITIFHMFDIIFQISIKNISFIFNYTTDRLEYLNIAYNDLINDFNIDLNTECKYKYPLLKTYITQHNINESFFDDIEDDIINVNDIITTDVQHMIYRDYYMIECNNANELYEFIIRNTNINDILYTISNAVKLKNNRNNINLLTIIYNKLSKMKLDNKFDNELYYMDIVDDGKYITVIKFISKDPNVNYNIDIKISYIFNWDIVISIKIDKFSDYMTYESDIYEFSNIATNNLIESFNNNLKKICETNYNELKTLKNQQKLHINESFFDDIEDDFTDEVSDTINNEIFVKQNLKDLNSIWNIIVDTHDYIKDHYNLNYNDKDNTLNLVNINSNEVYKQMYSAVEVKKDMYPVLQKFLDIAYDMGITKITFGFNCNGTSWSKTKDITLNEMDFHNIEFTGITIADMIPKNLIVTDKISDKKHGASVYIRACDLSQINTCKFGNITNITIEKCINVKDLSFLSNAKIYGYIRYDACGQNTMPECRNFTGLPVNGNYQVDIKFISKNDSLHVTDTRAITYDGIYSGINTFEGIPDNVQRLSITSTTAPNMIIPYLSFEGISAKLMANTSFDFYGFGGRNGKYILQVGPNIIEPKVRVFKFTKPLLQYMLKSGDYFMDCYKANEGPHKTYNPDDTLVQSKEYQSLQKKGANNEIKKQEKQEDFEKLVSLANKVLKTNVAYTTDPNNKLSRRLVIYKILPDGVTIFNPYNRWSLKNNAITWKQLFNRIKEYGYIDPDTGKTLYDLIVAPVAKERKKKDAEKKEQKKAEKASSNKIRTKKEITDTVSNNIDTKKQEAKKQIRAGITVNYDYSDKAIAIFGKTYDIKDQIKSIGGKYNPMLKLPNGDRGPGWILPKSKKDELDKILY